MEIPQNLASISFEYERTLQELEQYLTDNETDEVPEEFLERLAINKDELASKLEGYYMRIRSIKASEALLKERAKELVEKSKRKMQAVEFLESLVKKAVQVFGEVPKRAASKKISTPTVNVSEIERVSFKVDEAEVEDKYCYFGIALEELKFDTEEEASQFLDIILKALQRNEYEINGEIVRIVNTTVLKDYAKANYERANDLPKGVTANKTSHLRWS